MTRPVTSQSISPHAYADFPARIATGAPASPSFYDKIKTFFANRFLELRVAATTIYRSFSFSAQELSWDRGEIEAYKTAIEGYDKTADSIQRFTKASAELSSAAVQHFTRDPHGELLPAAMEGRDLDQGHKNQILHECTILLTMLKIVVKIKELFKGPVPQGTTRPQVGRTCNTPTEQPPRQQPIVQPPRQQPIVQPKPPTPPNPVKPVTPTPTPTPTPPGEPRKPLTAQGIWDALKLKLKPADPKPGQGSAPAEVDPSVAILTEPDSVYLFELNNYPTVTKREEQIAAMMLFLPNEAYTDVAKAIKEECSEPIAKFREKYQCGSLQDGNPMKLPMYHELKDKEETEARQDAAIMKDQLKKEGNPFDPDDNRKKCALCNEQIKVETVRIDLTLQREIASELEVLLSQMTPDQFVKRLKMLFREELAEDRTTTREVSNDPFDLAPVITIHVRKLSDEEILEKIGSAINDLPETMNGKPVRDQIVKLLQDRYTEI